MGTRASIRFEEDDEIFYVYRGHDGYPNGDILPDLRRLVDEAEGRWSPGGETGTLVTLFLAMNFDYEKDRLPNYEITSCIHGDEEYHYFVKYDRETKGYIIGYDEAEEE
jgi:hypothetical protein